MAQSFPQTPDRPLTTTPARAAPASASAPEAAPASALAVTPPGPAAAFPHHPPVPPAPEVGRIPIVDVSPVVDGGRFPSKAVVDEVVPVTVNAFREGHDAMGVQVVLLRPDGTEHTRVRARAANPGLDLWAAEVQPDAEGTWHLRVEAFSDVWRTWQHNAEIKVAAGIDVDLMMAEGVPVLERALADEHRDAEESSFLRRALAALQDESRAPRDRLYLAVGPDAEAIFTDRPLREHVTLSPDYPMVVHRRLALVGAWYEIFPRSEGAWFDEAEGRWHSGTLQTAKHRLQGIADMGFDVAYLTPIHPIGTTFRKGRNNTLHAEPGDPGSPYAIGSADGGHDAIHPDLGTFDDFDDFVAEARRLGLEVALDIALQCSPDHPWVTEHPEWFTHRADGSIAYAENPPKKYQDIYPLDFDNDYPGIYAAVRDVLEVWVDHGVTLFRVDNPHTKPVRFWEDLLAEFHAKHPEVIFLAEAFTRPTMMRMLAKVGFHQSYTYFAWRDDAEELQEYAEELAHETGAYFRPSFWPTTHDILTPMMTHGGHDAYVIRAILAATLSPTYGIYTGYEFVENVPRPGYEEMIDNEKYEYRPRDFDALARTGAYLPLLLGRLNAIRHEHPALQDLRSIVFHPADDPQVLAFSKHVPARFSASGADDTVLVVSLTQPHSRADTEIHLDRTAPGLDGSGDLHVTDLLTGQTFTWGSDPFVILTSSGRPAHILHVTRS
jgi:starch synthase (maltosyl-transferring)